MLVGIEENLGIAVNPESCREVGKECRECISSSASVVALLCPTLDAAAAQQTFFRMYRHQGCVLHVEIRGEVDTTCQRCLGRLTQELAIACDVALARDEAELERRNAESESSVDAILMSARLSLIELIEDEVLLGLPLAPMHAPGVCVIPAVII